MEENKIKKQKEREIIREKPIKRYNEITESNIGEMTIKELMTVADNVNINKNKIAIQTTMDNKIVTLEIVEFKTPKGTEYFEVASQVKKVDKKSYYKPLIKELKIQGFTQREIAYQLGLSQSYVSMLINQ